MSALTILAEECELLNDSKYRSYITQVDKALKSFEYTSEWADLISALGKLNKVLVGHTKYPVIPKRVTIGKRLAQCLHPALPSGVHLKALETYDIILKCIGTQRLAQDLFVYSAGLFPLLGHAAMSVKPVLLTVYERHFVALGKHVKPGLNGLLLGLLPGLEEGSEFHDRTNMLLDDFCIAVEPEYFYTCLWECVLSCPSVRLPAITFLVSHYNKKQSMEDQLYMMGLNIDLMVEAVCRTTQDSNVLVQRSLLDFLLLAFPMHNGQLTKCDMAKIVQAVVNVVLRRDMSLNRRLYSWLLGSSVSNASALANQSESSKISRSDSVSTSSEMDLSYFQTFSRDLLIQALKLKLISEKEEEEEDGKFSGKLSVLKPFRILMSLLDKPEIGPVILESVLLSVFRCLYRECGGRKKSDITQEQSTGIKSFSKQGESVMEKEIKAHTELIKTANLLFAAFEPYFIWDYIARLFEQALLSRHSRDRFCRSTSLLENDLPTIQELCSLVDFLVDIVSLETFLETQTEHLPDLLLRIITSLSINCDVIGEQDILSVLSICSKLLSKVQPSMNTIDTEDPADDEPPDAYPTESKPLTSGQEKKDISVLQNDVYIEVLQIEAPENGISNDMNSTETQKMADQDNLRENKKTLDQDDLQNKHQNESVFIQDTSSDWLKQRKCMVHKKQQLTLMQSCIEAFQNFYHLYATKRILKDSLSAKKFISGITRCSHMIPSTDSDSVFGSDSEFDDNFPSGRQCWWEYNKTHLTLEEQTVMTYKCACKLLLDFSSFPIYCTDYHKVLKRTQSRDQTNLPEWLQSLITMGCGMSNFQVQSCTIATILDLILLTQSTQPAALDRSNSSSGGTVSVLILPALSPVYLQYLSDNTAFYRVLAETLWGFLDTSLSSYHQRSVELFYLLHQVAPSTWICEDVIGNALVMEDESSRIEAYKRFTVLWHLTRDMRLDVNPGQQPRSFDRSMFVVLDSLKEDNSSVKTISSSWLSHVVQRNDISRVLNPLLLTLLHPDTARISVQHVNIHSPRSVKVSESSEDSNEAKIYAISNEGGQIIYHMAADNKRISQKFPDELRSCSLVTSDHGSTSVARTMEHSEQEFSFDKVHPDNLNLRINPWGSETSLDKSLDGFDLPTPTQNEIVGMAKRLDKETCVKEGIFFDGEELSVHDEGDSTPTEGGMLASSNSITGEDVVRDLLDGIIHDVVGKEELENNFAQKEQNTFAQNENKTKQSVDRAESVISKSSSMLEDKEILTSIDKRGMEIDSPSGSEADLTKDGIGQVRNSADVHPLHMHMLLYTQTYDYKRTLYALTTLKSILVTCPRLVVTAMVTTSISSIRTSQLAKLQMLLARHRKSVFGKNFFGDLPPEVMSNYRSNMFIEIIISVCLYFIRSYYPNLMKSILTPEELIGNKEVHIIATEVLTLLISELIIIMKESAKSFMSYIKDLLNRCKLQKALLHCCIASVFNSRKKSQTDNLLKITEAIIQYNETDLNTSANETFQIRLLNLLLVTIMLEGNVQKIQESSDSSSPSVSTEWDRPKVNFHASLLNAKFTLGQPIVHQGMFISFVLSALKQRHMCHMHHHWIAMVTTALPYMGSSLTGVVMNIVAQICRNLESLAMNYQATPHHGSDYKLPPDHIVTILEGLTRIVHYCLLDTSPPVSLGLPNPTNLTSTVDTSGPSQIFTNLIHVFNPVSHSRETSPLRELGPTPVIEARRGLLSIMPRIIACMSAMWKTMRAIENRNKDDQSICNLGNPKVIKQCILEFLSPISRPHGHHLMGAIGVAWNDCRLKINNSKMMTSPSEDQLLLVDLVSAIKVLPTDTLVKTVNKVLKQPPQSELGKAKKGIPLEVNMLQFFFAYVQQTSVSQLIDSWSSLLTLLRDGMQLNLSPSGKFILLQILNEFVQKMPMLEDKKSQKELQDLTQRLLEMVGMIAGSSLEQTTWLRRNLAVKPGPQNDKVEMEEEEGEADLRFKEKRVADPKLNTAVDSKYSVQALGLLADLTAPLLDVVYTSDEKDKIAPFLTTLLYNVFPYLRNHSVNNLPSFRACSQIMSSISSYQYSRKSWRKEALELLLDSGFFQMDAKCIGYWRFIIDNLMTHDKTTFKDLMKKFDRVTITQSGSLSLFSSKEQELEQRSIMLKRLAFTIFCSDQDQYQKSMPEIQERLAESLRVPHQAPSIMAQVFLCVRVLILRMSSHQLTSLWPTVITEMVHVFMQIEQELSNDTDEFKTSIQRIAALDSTWAHLGNGLNAHNNPAWLQLYLSVCKLLDLALALPADLVPQFQLYRWAFIGGAAAGNDADEDCDHEDEDIVTERSHRRKDKHQKTEKPKKMQKFTPHIIRITKLINARLQGATLLLKQTPGRPLITQTYIRSLAELQSFFNTLCLVGQSSENSFIKTSQKPGALKTHRVKQNGVDQSKRDMLKSKSEPSKMDKLSKQSEALVIQQSKSNRHYIEDLLEKDFLEPCPV